MARQRDNSATSIEVIRLRQWRRELVEKRKVFDDLRLKVLRIEADLRAEEGAWAAEAERLLTSRIALIERSEAPVPH